MENPLENFEKIEQFLNSDQCNNSLFETYFSGEFGPVLAMINFLTTMGDFFGKFKLISSLKKFKNSCLIIQNLTLKPALQKFSFENQPLTNENIDFQVEFLSKWWLTYFSILKQTYFFKIV